MCAIAGLAEHVNTRVISTQKHVPWRRSFNTTTLPPPSPPPQGVTILPEQTIFCSILKCLKTFFWLSLTVYCFSNVLWMSFIQNRYIKLQKSIKSKIVHKSWNCNKIILKKFFFLKADTIQGKCIEHKTKFHFYNSIIYLQTVIEKLTKTSDLIKRTCFRSS